MLNKNWKVGDGTFNPPQPLETLQPESIAQKYKNLSYFTLPFDIEFENVDNAVIFSDMAKQQDHIRKEVALYMKHDYFNKAIHDKIMEQYGSFYLYKDHYYKIDELRLRLTKKSAYNNTFIQTQEPTPQELEHKSSKPIVTISREAIRKISGYSPYVVPAWATDGKQVYIKWQDVILQDESPIILIDGSRQIGKSLTIAEKATELSFLPNEDTLVGGFIKKTTDVIRNYMLRFIKKFPEGTFEHFKSEGYILNTRSGTKIYFRTLDNGAENVLGLTLKNIIVDESQLIPTDVFEDVLEPTLATTNGRMILIGTAGKNAKGYYYDLIMEAKRGIEVQGIKIAVKCETNPDISYYQIDYTQNPLLAPRLREKVIKNLHKASVQRQYCCNWNSGEGQLFKPEISYEFPVLGNEGFFVITFDPARSGVDRSAFCVTFTSQGVVYVILSGFVPQEHKAKWSQQILFYAKGLIKQFMNFEHVIYGVDLRGIGEGFTEAWKNYFKVPNPRLALLEMTYTSGDTETIKGLNWKVSKTKFITNAIDLIDEGIVKVLKPTNTDLLEELQFIYDDTDGRGQQSMKTSFKDDIANCFMTNLYIISQRGLIKKFVSLSQGSKNEFDEWGKDFVSKKKRPKITSAW